MTRLVALAAACALLTASAAAQAAPRSWAQPQIKLVTSKGLLGGSAAMFRPDDPLTRGALASLAAGLTGTPVAPVAKAGAPVTVAQLDVGLVRALGLRDTAYRFYLAARRAGTRPPSLFRCKCCAFTAGLVCPLAVLGSV
jgi:hypothetical protein